MILTLGSQERLEDSGHHFTKQTTSTQERTGSQVTGVKSECKHVFLTIRTHMFSVDHLHLSKLSKMMPRNH